jgi:sulfonate transport system substrate-binding protein
VFSTSKNTRRTALTLFSLVLPLVALGMLGSSTSAVAQSNELRIGYQKAASTLVLLKAHGSLEKRLKSQGINVKWAEFSAGPQLLEALNVGSIDFGYVGEAPPVFAQAAGANFVYTAYEIPTPEAEGLLVPKNSPIKTVADLKGKKIAFNKGSDVHWLVVALLKKAGLSYSDIQPVYLAPADARAAFERGAIDAWAIWDPFQAAAEKQLDARRLASGTGTVSHHQFFLSSRPYAEKNQAVLKILMEEVSKEGDWIRHNNSEAAAQLAPIQGLDNDVIETSLKRYAHVFKSIDAGVLAEQQRIADAFFDLKLIPVKLNVQDAVLK